VGYNVAKALTRLGDQVNFISLVGQDFSAEVVKQTLAADHIPGELVVKALPQTAQSVILYDAQGRRQINVDLKNIQETAYPQERFAPALAACEAAILCNINFSRPFLAKVRQAGKLIATDVHTISQLDDPYNQDFMRAAHVLFMSDESLPCPPKEWARQVLDRYGNEILVIGLGGKGALLCVRTDHYAQVLPAVQTRPIVNTIGAGDALFSCFVHYYTQSRDPYDALRRAIVFASYKIGAAGAAEGLMEAKELESLYQQTHPTG
jgi:ribokinase